MLDKLIRRIKERISYWKCLWAFHRMSEDNQLLMLFIEADPKSMFRRGEFR